MKEEDELTYGETIKQPFPKLEDIEWVMVEAPCWLNFPFISTSTSGFPRLEAGVVYDDIELYNTEFVYHIAKEVYENSQDLKVTWKLKEVK